MSGLKWLALPAAGSHHLNDPAGTAPGFLDVIWGFFCTQRPDDVAAMAVLVIRCCKRDVAFSLELQHDLLLQALLVCFNGQEEVGSLLLEL